MCGGLWTDLLLETACLCFPLVRASTPPLLLQAVLLPLEPSYAGHPGASGDQWGPGPLFYFPST